MDASFASSATRHQYPWYARRNIMLVRYMGTKPVDKCASLCLQGAQPGEQGLHSSAVHTCEQTCISPRAPYPPNSNAAAKEVLCRSSSLLSPFEQRNGDSAILEREREREKTSSHLQLFHTFPTLGNSVLREEGQFM